MARAEQLVAIQSRYEKDLLSTPGVLAVGIGIDEATHELLFFVTVDERGAPPKLPSAIEGVPLRVDFGEPAVPLDGGSSCMAVPNNVPGGGCHSNTMVLPAEMGNSGKTIDTCSMCTMGFKACEVATDREVWVTNAHCSVNPATSCPGSAALGTATSQASLGDNAGCTAGSNVGTVARHAVPGGSGGTTVDATSIYSTSYQTSATIRDIGTPSILPGSTFLWDVVQKSGRTTGWTFGLVTGINVSATVSYNCGSVTMTSQIRILDATGDTLCEGGDSGSAFLNFDGPPKLVGLLIANAGSTTCYANDISNVISSLGLALDLSQCTYEPDCPAEAAAAGTDEPESTIALMYKLRDDILTQTELGKRWVDRFYAVSHEWFQLYTEQPALIKLTADVLDDNLGVLDAIAFGEAVTVSKAQFSEVSQLLKMHARAAPPRSALRRAMRSWTQELRDPEVMKAFGVTVEK